MNLKKAKNIFNFLRDINGKPSYKRIVGFGCFITAIIISFTIREVALVTAFLTATGLAGGASLLEKTKNKNVK